MANNIKPIDPGEQATQIIQSAQRYLKEIRDAITVQIPLNVAQALYQVPLDNKLKDTLRTRFDILVTGVLQRAGSRLEGIERSLLEAELQITKLSPVKQESDNGA